MTASELVEFWSQCPLDKPPYQHPCDELPTGSILKDVRCYADYADAFNKRQLSDTAFHLHLLPQPYHGDLENARLIILLTNPGFHASDYVAEEEYPEFKQAIVKTIRQEVFSHMFLDPKWAWTSGFSWWERKLRKVVQRIASDRFKGSYPEALAQVAQSVACLELVPYHSMSFRGTTGLTSTAAARKFAQEASKDRKVIVPRSVKAWGLGNGPNVIAYDPNQARGASLGPTSLAGREILALYGLK